MNTEKTLVIIQDRSQGSFNEEGKRHAKFIKTKCLELRQVGCEIEHNDMIDLCHEAFLESLKSIASGSRCVIFIIMYRGDGGGKYYPETQSENPKPVELIVQQINSIQVIEHCPKIILFIDFEQRQCDVNKPLYCSNVKNIIVFLSATEKSNRNGNSSRIELIDALVINMVNLKERIEVNQLAQRIQDSYTRKMSNGNELSVPVMTYPMEADFYINSNSRVPDDFEPTPVQEFPWMNQSGSQLAKGHCFIFHDSKHTKVAKSLECSLQEQCLTWERHFVADICVVLSQVSKKRDLYNDFGVIIIAVFAKHLKSQEGYLCIDTGKCFRYASDIFLPMSSLNETQTFELILDCEYEAVDQILDEVLRSDHQRLFSPSIEFCAKGEALVEALIKDLAKIDVELSIQQILFETLKKFSNCDSSIFSNVNHQISLRKCKKIEVPLSLQTVPDNGELPREIDVASVAKEMINLPSSSWILSGAAGAGKSVTTRQVARYFVTHFPDHQVVYTSEKLLNKLCTSNSRVTPDLVMPLFATNESELVEIKEKQLNQKLIIMVDDLQLVLREHAARVRLFLGTLKELGVTLWLSIREFDFEILRNCLDRAFHLITKPLSIDDQAKILSTKLNLPRSAVSMSLQKVSLGTPLHLEMVYSLENLTSPGFDFYLDYVMRQITIVLPRRNLEPNEEMCNSSLHELLVACVKLRDSGSYHADYQSFDGKNFGFHQSFANFFLAYNFSASMGLENEIFHPVQIDKIFSQRDLYQEREFIEMRLAKSSNLKEDFSLMWSGLVNTIETLKMKAHHCIYNVINEGCVRLCSFLLNPEVLNALGIENFLDPYSQFMQHWRKDYPEHSPLFYALKSKEEVVALMLMRSSSFKPLPEMKFYIHEAAKKGYIQATQLLMQSQLQNALNETDDRGFTALHYAVYHNQIEWVRMFLLMRHASATVNVLSPKEVTPVFYAAGNCNLEIFRFLVMYGADTRIRDAEGSIVLHWILKSKANNWLEMLQLVLSLRLCDVNCRDNRGETALFVAARENKFSAFPLLAENGADMSVLNENGQSLLHIIAQSGDAEACLQMMARLNTSIIKQIDRQGRTALHFAVEANCNVDVVQLMLLSIAEFVTGLDLHGQNVLHLAVKHSSEHVVELLAEIDDMHYICDVNGDTPMHLAAKSNDIAALRLLVARRPEVLTMSDEPLMRAAIETRNARAIKFMHIQLRRNSRNLLDSLNFESLHQIGPNHEMSDVQADGAVAGPSRNMHDFEDEARSMEVEEDDFTDTFSAGPSAPVNKRYNYFVNEHLHNLNLNFALHRYFTFKREISHEKRYNYAQSGFFYTRDDENIQCHYCLLLIPFTDDYGVNLSLDQVNARHGALCKRETRKPCPLISGGDVQDVPIVNPSNFIFESHRLYSLLSASWPNPFVSVYDLAKYGFYYTGQDDNCRCLFCKLEVRGWEPGDTAEGEHRRWNPRCPFLAPNRQTENVKIGEELNTPESDHLSNPFKPTPIAKFGPHVKFCKNAKPGITIEALGITPVGDMKYRQYSTLQSREKSFKIWPKQLAQKPEVLSTAGFFYTGSGDRVICFQCGGGLKDWDPKDNPWVEHAKWFSRCPYLSIKRGKKFIDDIIRTNEEQATLSQDGPTIVKKAPVPGSLQCWVCKSKDANCVSLPCGHITTCVYCVEKELDCRACDRRRVAYTEVFL
ncbi:uncharacterized protein LOC135944969 isoform X2 [Cloeon dipterum]|uniref:uncharacterized protein LOC135944969 isoform X2 n=1 Tax=Cloeon dipterum TaxID=197152 RepID=UPI0032207B19